MQSHTEKIGGTECVCAKLPTHYRFAALLVASLRKEERSFPSECSGKELLVLEEQTPALHTAGSLSSWFTSLLIRDSPASISKCFCNFKAHLAQEWLCQKILWFLPSWPLRLMSNGKMSGNGAFTAGGPKNHMPQWIQSDVSIEIDKMLFNYTRIHQC